ARPNSSRQWPISLRRDSSKSMRFQYMVFDRPPKGSRRSGRGSPSSTNGSSSSRAFDLPAVLGPRRISQPSASQNSWLSYSQTLRMPARSGRKRSEEGRGRPRVPTAETVPILLIAPPEWLKRKRDRDRRGQRE